MKQIFSNPNEITKGEFDDLNKVKDFDIFTPQQISITALELAKLVKKGEVSELSDYELDLIKSGTAELKNLTKYTINEMKDGRIVKNDVYCQPKQVKWLDVIEKSETGEKIEKGIYLDTDLNKELGRVGVTFQKGKVSKSEDEPKGKDEPESMEEKMVEKCMKSLKKADGDDEGVKEEMKKAFPEATDKEVEKAIKKAYKGLADDFMKKAEEDDTEKGEEDEIKDKSKK